jgi:hypothetical protein
MLVLLEYLVDFSPLGDGCGNPPIHWNLSDGSFEIEQYIEIHLIAEKILNIKFGAGSLHLCRIC